MEPIFYIDESTKELRVIEAIDYNFSGQGSKTVSLDTSKAISYFREAAKSGVPTSQDGEYPAVIYPQFTTISADKATRNKTRYSSESHKGDRKKQTGQHSYTKPYPIPMIRDHKSAPECGEHASDVFGRIINAKFIKNLENGKAFTAALGEVTDPVAIDKILTGRWLTGSQGSAVHDAKCSVCGKSLMDRHESEGHPHLRGKFYRPVKKKNEDGEVTDDWEECDPKARGAMEALIDIDSWSAREWSDVVIPSDDEAIITIPDTVNQPGSYFTRVDTGNPNPSESNKSALWVPMSPSSRAGLENWGDRYIDLVSGVEQKASELGFFSGKELHSHYERILSGDDSDILNESATLAELSQIYVFPDYKNLDETETPSRDGILETETTVETETFAGLKEDLGLPEGKLSTNQRSKLKTTTFCGPDRSFPVPDQAHAVAGLRMVDRYKGPGNKAKIRACILKHARKSGWAVGGAKKPDDKK